MKNFNKLICFSLSTILFAGCGQSTIDVTNTKALIRQKDNSFYNIYNWQKKANLLSQMEDFALVSFNNKLYTFGGDKINIWLADNSAYDILTDKWEQKTPMSTNRSGLSAGVINSKIYVTGGFDGVKKTWLGTLEVYDPINDKWEIKSSMTNPRSGLGIGVINNKLYAVGGDVASKNWTDKLEVYNPDNDTWQSLPSMTIPRARISTAVNNNQLYVFGGENQDGVLKDVEEYIPKLNIWRKRADMPTARSHAAIAVYKSNIMLIGGRDADNKALDTIDIYNIDTNTWSSGKNTSMTREGSKAIVEGNTLYIAGGLNNLSLFDNFENTTLQ
ncbi:MAG: hypothetical protein H7263_06525 [Candidatus Sericytochromatia bacterium]|nr:hypothetical protein [Candidatus Sericytochromatia bacterium]